MQPLLLLTESLPNILQKKEKRYVKFAAITALVDMAFLGYCIWRLVTFISAKSVFKNDSVCDPLSNWLFDMQLFYIYSIFTKMLTPLILAVRSQSFYISLLFLWAAEIPFRITFWNRHNRIGESITRACFEYNKHEMDVYEEVPIHAVYIENAVSLGIIASLFFLMKAAKVIREFKRIVTLSAQRSNEVY